jgi:chromosome segregation ATPase
MLGTIEDLERDIEQFRNNVAASNEMYTLLNQMLEQVRQQNTTFDRKSEDLLGRLDAIPTALDTANAASNAAVKKDVSAEIDRAISDFASEQTKYLQALEQTQKEVHTYTEQSQKQAQSFDEKSAELIVKVASVPEQIKADTRSSLEEYRSSLDADIEKRNAQLAETQKRYVSAMEDTSGRLKSCEEQLLSKYQEFLQTLEKTNLSNLYEQNQKLQSELNKRTTLLMIISAVSVVLGIVGLIL